MKFKTDFLAEDYSELCWFQTRIVSTILAVLLSIAAGATIFAIFRGRFFFISLAVIVVGIPIICKIMKKIVIGRADRRYGAYGASSELYLEINDDEILQTSAKGDTRLPWEDVYAVCESQNCYYVFLTKRKAFYFPKRSFESEEQKIQFFEYIEKYVPKKKIKIKNKCKAS